MRWTAPMLSLLAGTLAAFGGEISPVGPARIILAPEGHHLNLSGEYWWSLEGSVSEPLTVWPVGLESPGDPVMTADSYSVFTPSFAAVQTGELLVRHWNQQPRVVELWSMEDGSRLETHTEREGFSSNFNFSHLVTPESFWTIEPFPKTTHPTGSTVSRLDRKTSDITTFDLPFPLTGERAVDLSENHLCSVAYESTPENGVRHLLKILELNSRQLTYQAYEAEIEESSQPLIRNGVVAVGSKRLGYALNKTGKRILFYSSDGSLKASHDLPPESDFERSTDMIPTHDGFWMAYWGTSGGRVEHFKLGGAQLFEIDFTGEVKGMNVGIAGGVSDRYFAFTISDSRGLALFDRKAPPTLKIEPAEAHENDGILTITVSLNRSSDQTVRCRIVSNGGLASPNIDYELLDELLVFPPGVTEQTIDLDILPDTIPELHETVGLELTECDGAEWNGEPSAAIIRASGVILKPGIELNGLPEGFGPEHSYRRNSRPVFASAEVHISRIRELRSGGGTRFALFSNLDNHCEVVLDTPTSGLESGLWQVHENRVTVFTPAGRHVSWSRSTGEVLSNIPWSNLPVGQNYVPNISVPVGDSDLFLLGNANDGVVEVDQMTGARRTVIAASEFSGFTTAYSSHADKPLYLGACHGTYWALGWMEPSGVPGTARAEFQLRSYDAKTLSLIRTRTLQSFEFPESTSTTYNAPTPAVVEGRTHVVVGDVCYDAFTLEPRWNLSELRHRMAAQAGYNVHNPTISALGDYFLVNAASDHLHPNNPTQLLEPSTMTLVEELDYKIPSILNRRPDFSDATAYGTEIAWEAYVKPDPWEAGWTEIYQLSIDRRIPAFDVTASTTIAPHGLTLRWTAHEDFDQPYELFWSILETDDAQFLYNGPDIPQVPEYFVEPNGMVSANSSTGSIDLIMHPSGLNWPEGFEIDLEWKAGAQGQSTRPAQLSSRVVEPGVGVRKQTFSHHPKDIGVQVQGIDLSDRWLAIRYPNYAENGEIIGRVDVFDRRTSHFIRSFTRPESGQWSGFAQLAEIHGDRILIASPSYGEFGEPDNKAGEVFLFDIPTGALLHTFTNTLNVPGYGFSLACNDTYFCIGAPGIDPDTTRPSPVERGGFEVFTWSDLRSVWKKTTAGEMLGDSLAFHGDDLYVGASYASPRLGTQKLYFFGAIHQFEIPRKRLIETHIGPEPAQFSRFGEYLRIAGDRMATGPRTFYQFDDQIWYALQPPDDNIPFFGSDPVLNERYLSATHTGKLQIADLQSGRIHIGGPDEGHFYVSLSDDDRVYWSDRYKVYGIPIYLIEGFYSWSTMLGKDLSHFDEYLEEAGATYSLSIEPHNSDPLLTDLLPHVDIPIDAEATIDKSHDLKSWSPAFKRDASGEWSGVMPATESSSPSEFYRLRIERHPDFAPRDER